jgi:hypothetical protein
MKNNHFLYRTFKTRIWKFMRRHKKNFFYALIKTQRQPALYPEKVRKDFPAVLFKRPSRRYRFTFRYVPHRKLLKKTLKCRKLKMRKRLVRITTGLRRVFTHKKKIKKDRKKIKKLRSKFFVKLKKKIETLSKLMKKRKLFEKQRAEYFGFMNKPFDFYAKAGKKADSELARLRYQKKINFIRRRMKLKRLIARRRMKRLKRTNKI